MDCIPYPYRDTKNARECEDLLLLRIFDPSPFVQFFHPAAQHAGDGIHGFGRHLHDVVLETVILLSRHQIISQKNEQLFVFCDIILIPLSTENVASRSDEISKRSISSWTSYLHLSAWIFDPFLVLTISSLKLPIKPNDCKNFLHLFLR